ncbi:hypothetical protein AHF37_12137 [Paragonimus kellicotti]|nr:hypothetical protein AHF37_12137 [Paragonimus kellicotti]
MVFAYLLYCGSLVHPFDDLSFVRPVKLERTTYDLPDNLQGLFASLRLVVNMSGNWQSTASIRWAEQVVAHEPS